MTDLLSMVFSPEEAEAIRNSVRKLTANSDRLDILANGDESAFYTTTDGVEVPSIRRFLAEMRGKA